MSATDSNLTEAGYDLVLGVTQDAINANLKRYLDNADIDFEPAYYVFTDGSATDVVPITAEQLQNLTTTPEFPNGIDPFTDIPNNLTSDNTDPANAQAVDAGNVLFNVLFAFAFQAEVGFPRNSPDVIILNNADNNPQTVGYQMYFEEFTVVNLLAGRGDYWTYEKMEQASDDPWIYSWSVDLNIVSTDSDFASLPPATQAALQNVDSSSMFSIQQLALDLTNAPQSNGLVSDQGAPIEGQPLFNQYLNSYWDYLKDTEATILLSGVQPSDPTASAPTLVPTSMNFIIKSYDGTTENAGLDTLNYLVMSDNNPLPDPVTPITWNWLAPPATSSTELPSGVMAVQKADFVQYVKTVFEDDLSSICLIPAIDVDFSFGDYPFHYSQSFYQDPSFTIIDEEDDESHVLGFSYRSPTSEDSDFAYASEIWSYVQSDIYFENDTIRCETFGEVYIELDLKAGVTISSTKGDILAQKNTATFTMSTNPDGSLHVDLTSSVENLLQSDDKDAPYYAADPSSFAALFNVDDMLNKIANQADQLGTWINNYNAGIKQLLNDTSAWVFPGTDTFSMLNPTFSDTQDLTIEVSYTTD
ncbi:MAG: hypothetical protein ACRBFS_05655 [Aureispira sp.]